MIFLHQIPKAIPPPKEFLFNRGKWKDVRILLKWYSSLVAVFFMKLVMSRKGFDSGYGGVPSPVGPEGEMVSLPIESGSTLRYCDLDSDLGPMSKLAIDLTRARFDGTEIAHLDPDLNPLTRPRLPGWRPSLGQAGAAQSHLEGQGVGVGDVMLFFGWFRPAENTDGKWRFVPGSESFHACFGYLQIGESLRVGPVPDTKALLAHRPWLNEHPHVEGERPANNTIHIASDELVLGGRPTGLPGGGHFPLFHPSLRLTAPGAPKSRWRIPEWLSPALGGPGMSYHGAPTRWGMDEEGFPTLQTVAKGQEFVADCTNHPQALEWIEGIVRNGLGAPKPASRTKMRGPR